MPDAVHIGRSTSEIAATIAIRLLELGLAEPADWARSLGKAPVFLDAVLERWVKDAGGELVGKGMGVHAAMTTDVLGWVSWAPGEDPTAVSPDRLWLVLAPTAAGVIQVGNVVSLMEPVHPRLPATFVDGFRSAMNKVLGVFDFYEAADHAEWWDWMEDEEEQPIRPRDQVPAALKRRPLTARAAMRAVNGLEARIRRPIELVFEMQRLADEIGLTPWPEDVIERVQGGGWQQSYPGVLMVVESGDDTERVFDEVMDQRAQMGEPVLPPWALAFDLSDDDQVRGAHRRFTGAVRLIAAASQAIHILPDADPRTLAEALREVD